MTGISNCPTDPPLGPTPTPTLAPQPAADVTGINPWWAYEEGAIPGAGKWMLNVGTGNLIVQDADVDITERGIDLAFQRTYNVMSQHDYANDDGSVPSLYGNEWTNTFDAHMAYDSAANVLSVYDVDGARYDYCTTGNGLWNSCTPGQYATLTFDGTCSYRWTKKSGTTYQFWSPTGSTCDGGAGFNGRLAKIDARNQNNWVRFDYFWTNGDASSPANVTQINAVHADGQTLTLTFADFNGRRLLSSITRPDGGTITYGYDANGNLTDVCKLCNETDGSAQHIQYGWGSAGIAWVSSPNWVANNPSYPGAYVAFAQDGNGRTTSVQDIGTVNFTPADGTNAVLQSGVATGSQTFHTATFNYRTANQTALTDTDGHATTWAYDTIARVTQTQEWTGSIWLTTTAAWDAQNNVTSATDARGQTTAVGYDSNGNILWVQGPPTATNIGTIQPTARYAYDAYNNLTAYCDPIYVAQTGVTSCSAVSGVAHYAYDYSDPNEQFGRLVDAYTPLGYHAHFTYDANGMPTLVQGDAFAQTDGSNRTPTKAFQYDGSGNLVAYSTLSSTIVTSGGGRNTWTLTYDALNRQSTVTDPDGYTSYTYHNSDGSVSRTETPYQHALAKGATFTYDPDGNTLTKAAFIGGSYNSGSAPTLPSSASVTQDVYDGADRLVEVILPHDATDVFDKAWMTRYDYDLSAGGSVSLAGTAYAAHGGLYKTQEYLPANSGSLAVNSGGNMTDTTWEDTKGDAFDALGRATEKFYFSKGALQHDTDAYDDPSALGMLHQHCNAVNQCSTDTYDGAGHLASVAFNDATPGRSMTYDADGRTVGISSPYGTQQYTFDADGRETVSIEPTGTYNGWSGATLTYHYYPDGVRQSLDVASAALNQAGLLAYSYRNDGKLDQERISLASNPLVGTTTLNFTYSNAGRLQQRTESGPAANAATITSAYDAYGQLQQTVVPGGTLGAMEYDAVGNLLGRSGATTIPRTLSYTVRGELRSSQMGSSRYANGVGASVGPPTPGQPVPTFTWTWDPRMGVMSDVTSVAGSTTNDSNFTFDAAGRNAAQMTTSDNPNGGPDGGGTSSEWDLTRTYDAENHLISQKGTEGDASYLWGPNGHPAQIGSATYPSTTYSYENLHWDGNQLLFTTNSSGQLDDIKIGAIGDITPLDPNYSGLTFYDRAPGGAVAYCHNATGAAGTGDADPYSWNTKFGVFHKNPCTSNDTGKMPTNIEWWADNTSAGARLVGRGWILGMPRTDGLSDGLNAIQGVRTFDSTLGGWTTPDAYAGAVTNPQSQKAYVWNGNNPIAFADPSGYSPLNPSMLQEMNEFDKQQSDVAGDARVGNEETPKNAGTTFGSDAPTDLYEVYVKGSKYPKNKWYYSPSEKHYYRYDPTSEAGPVWWTPSA